MRQNGAGRLHPVAPRADNNPVVLSVIADLDGSRSGLEKVWIEEACWL
jgi:hypothetical protein